MKEAKRFHDDFFVRRPDLVQGIVNIHFPPRTSRLPTHIIDRTWLDYTNSSWPDFRIIAIERLADRPEDPSAEIDLLRLDPASLNEKFVLARSAIRANLGLAKYVRLAYKYFVLGREIRRESEPIMEITRKELLQLYIVSYVRKYVVEEMQEYRIDKLMRRMPEGGGPLFTA